MSKKQKKLLYRILIALILFIGAFCFEKFTSFNKWFYIVAYLFPYLTVGYDVLYKSVRNVLHGLLFDECFLMFIATLGAFAVGEFPEGVFVMLFYQLGELFQGIAVSKSRASIAGLMDIRPDTAVVLREGGEEEVFPEEVEVGETVLVKPGERIPIDGLVLTGNSSLDTSSLTGESLPRDIKPNDKVISGCINLTGAITVQATCRYEDSSVAKILELVENSAMNKSKSESFITRFARYYTPCVVIAAFLLALIPSVITKQPADWIYRACIFLVVSCPCALVISIPLAFFAGIGGAAKQGILVKGGNYLEALAQTQIAVFDKTGTLTKGSFEVTKVIPVTGVTPQQLTECAATAEYRSNHPIGKAICSYCSSVSPPDSVTEIPGMGIKAVKDGHTVLSGSAELLNKNGITVSEAANETNAATRVYVALDKRYLGVIEILDTVKPAAKDAIASLNALGITDTVMLTGDNGNTAKAVAGALHIGKYFAGLLPQQKVEHLEALLSDKQKDAKLIFVGDGINDAPVLTRADVGIAMGALGSDAAIEAADIVIMDDDLKKLPVAIRISKRTKRIVIQNTVLALAVKLGVLILAAFGLTNMWIGVFADVGVAMLAIINSMQMLRSIRK